MFAVLEMGSDCELCEEEYGIGIKLFCKHITNGYKRLEPYVNDLIAKLKEKFPERWVGILENFIAENRIQLRCGGVMVTMSFIAYLVQALA